MLSFVKSNDDLKSLIRISLGFMLLSFALLLLFRLSTLVIIGGAAEMEMFRRLWVDLLWTGFRFDLKVAAIILLFPFLLLTLVVWLPRWRWYLALVFQYLRLALVLLLAIGLINLGYYLFFGNAIDLLIFGFLQDDTLAVLQSILLDWRLLSISIAGFAGCVVLFLWLNRFKPEDNHFSVTPNRLNRFFIVFIALAVLVVSARGSFGIFPLNRKFYSISNNPFFNSLVLNAPMHLHHATEDYLENRFNFTSRDVLKSARVDSIDELVEKSGLGVSLEDLVHVTSPKTPVPHVLFLLMEGWGTHQLLYDSESNQMLGSMKQHVEEDYLFTGILANRYGTNPTVESILLNTYITPLSQSTVKDVAFSSTSNVQVFKDAGYQTTFYSGGFSSWRNHDNFWPLQGFDRYLDRSVIVDRYQVVSEDPWGVYDENLFQLIFEELSNATSPTFGFALTTTNHSPVILPSDYKPGPINLSEFNLDVDDEFRQNMVMGYQYSMNALGDFMTRLKQSELADQIIVVATGDHALRGFHEYPSSKEAYWKYSTPVYLYVPEQWDQLKQIDPDSVIGSHVDIFPTLFELSLDQRPYLSFGASLIEPNEKAYGWARRGVYLFADGLAPNNSSLLPWKNRQFGILEAEGKPLQDWQKRVMKQEASRKRVKNWLVAKQVEESDFQLLPDRP